MNNRRNGVNVKFQINTVQFVSNLNAFVPNYRETNWTVLILHTGSGFICFICRSHVVCSLTGQHDTKP